MSPRDTRETDEKECETERGPITHSVGEVKGGRLSRESSTRGVTRRERLKVSVGLREEACDDEGTWGETD